MHLWLSDAPDGVQEQRPPVYARCAALLEGVPAQGRERRQVQELPLVRLVVTEDQKLRVCCPHYHTLATGVFPQMFVRRCNTGRSCIPCRTTVRRRCYETSWAARS